MDQLPEGIPAPLVRPEQRPPVILQVRAYVDSAFTGTRFAVFLRRVPHKFREQASAGACWHLWAPVGTGVGLVGCSIK